ncbi:ORF6N domain-containing protein [Bergeyella porcorum]
MNQAVKNNPEKFPMGYILELNKEEKAELVKNFDHLQRLKFSKALPKAFTEKGLYMLTTILKGEKATQTTLSIVETFAKIRELSRTISDLSEIKNKAEQKSLMQKSGEIISEILGEEMKTTDTETTVELNFAVLKLKHTIKRKTDKT